MQDKLKVGVAGLRMGKDHIDGYLTHPRAEIAAVCDTNPEVLAKVAEEYAAKGRYTDFNAMIDSEQLDVVSIVTPNSFHRPMSEYALARGCHVLCEKPIGMDTNDALAMQEAARAAGRRIMVDYSYRFKPESVAVKRQVESGVLGDICSAQVSWLRNKDGFSQITPWFSNKRMSGGGCLIDLGSHCLDLVLWYLDFPKPVSVTATTHDAMGRRAAAQSGRGFDVEDAVEAFIVFDNGTSLTLQVSWAANIPEDNLIQLRLLGTDAGIIERNIDQGYSFDARIFQEHDGVFYESGVASVASGLVETPMHHFIEAICTDQPHQSGAEEAIASMRLIDAIYESAAARRSVAL